MAYFMMSITMSFHPFALSPGTLHRVMVSESDDVLRKGLAPLHWRARPRPAEPDAEPAA
jgi:hypothetical protein